ncbi:MAG: hypothetical protein WAW96_21100 [Alphaproteobacteria bacterium]
MQPDKARSNPDGLLLDYARRLERHRPGRRALWFHLSRLQRQNRDQADLQLAAKQLSPLAQKYHGEVFVLSNSDIVACVKDANLREIETAVFALHFTFARDPLMKLADTEGTQVFLTSFDMVDQYDAFMSRVTAVANGELVEPGAAPPKQPAGLGERLMLSREELKQQADSDPLDGHVLTPQGQIAIDRLLDRRQIATFESGRAREWGARNTVRLEAIDAFDSLAMAIARHRLEPSDALGEVERTLLSAIGEHIKTQARPNQIVAFRTEALISPEFLLFDRHVTAAKEGKPRIAFWAEEVRDHLDTINYLRSFLTTRGYTLGITGLDLAEVAELASPIANLRFVEIDHPREIEAGDAELIKRLLTRFGPESVILSEIQTQKALVIARRAGVRLLSGPIIDEAL